MSCTLSSILAERTDTVTRALVSSDRRNSSSTSQKFVTFPCDVKSNNCPIDNRLVMIVDANDEYCKTVTGYVLARVFNEKETAFCDLIEECSESFPDIIVLLF